MLSTAMISRGSRTLLWTALACLSLATVTSARLVQDVAPVHQTVDLRIDSDTTHYSGSVTIELDVTKTLSSFQLHAEEMQLTNLRLTGAAGTVEVEYEIGKHGLMTITAASELTPGAYELYIAFDNDFNTDAVGLYRVTENEHGYLFTQFEEDDAREAFPCFDEPEFKIPFALTLTVPDEHLAIANTLIKSESVNDGWRTVVFAETKPLPTYLVAIATGLLETVEIPGLSTPGRVVTVQGKSHLTKLAIKMTPPILAAMEEYFGSPYPYDKLDLIAVPEFWAGAMENAGAITFRETGLAVDENSISVGGKRRMASTIAHEIAHMWFGDLVTMVWWDDLWLNEAFASWMGDKITDEIFPEFNMPVAVVRSSQSVMSSDARKSTSPIRQETTDGENLLANIGIIYSKGQAVLEMFEDWLGDEPFRDGIRQYLKKHEWGNATADDLWNALSDVSGQDVNTPLSTFILQPGVPLITIEPGAAGEVTISQNRFGNYGVEFPDAPLWQIPITLKYSSGGEIKTHSLLLTDATQTVRLAGETRPDWILPNANMAGYFRWVAPPAMLSELARQATTAFTASERVGFMSNMSGLLDAGLISAGDYLGVISKFASDEDPDVIRDVRNSLTDMHEIFVTDKNYAQYASFIRKTLQPALKRFGLTKREGEAEAVSLLRSSLIGFLGDEGEDSVVMAFAEEQAAAFLADPSAVDPSLIGTCLALTCMNGDQALFDEFRNRFENAQTPADRSRYLSCLGGFEDQQIVDQAMAYALTGPLRSQERGRIPFGIAFQSSQRQDFVLDWVMEHYDEIISQMPPPSRARLAFFLYGCDEARLAKGQAFFAEPAHNSPGINSRLARVAEAVTDCVSLRAREEASVAAFLDQVVSPKYGR